MTVTVAGTYTSPDESPLSGWVALSLANPRAVHSTAPEFVASKRVVSELDETGSVSFEVVASDDPGWELGPVLYRVEEHLSQQEHLTWFGYLTEPVEGGGVRLEEVARIADPELGYWPPALIPGPEGPPGDGIVMKGTVATWADLPATGNEVNDAYLIADDPGLVGVWSTAGAWERLVTTPGPPGPSPHIGDDEPTDPEIVEWFDTNEPSVRGVLNSGDTMTGPLILSGDAVEALGAVTKQQLDAGGGVSPGPVNTQSVDGAYTIPATHEFHQITMTGDTTFTMPTGLTDDGFVFAVTLDGVFTPTWDASVTWADGVGPTYAPLALFTFYTEDAGVSWLGSYVGGAFA